MTVFLYNILIRCYNAAIFIASFFNKKAGQWRAGRVNIFEKLKAEINTTQPVIWMHCASLGEFEQGRPVLEKLKSSRPDYKILLTFFSPSGYEVRKNYAGADWVFYLPIDTKKNARQFLQITKPALAIFVKYEYWYHYLHQLHQKNIPAILISAIFRQDAIFFKNYGGLHRKMLGYFTQIFVQDKESLERLKSIMSGQNVIVAGDTRFDRVAAVAKAFEPIEIIEKFTTGRDTIVAGSTWPEDEKNLKYLLEKQNNNISLIIAPHEINNNHLKFLSTLFQNAVLFSQLQKDNLLMNEKNTQVLIIDNIGMLSKLYKYATIAYVGGGFNKSGIHNTLEAAVYNKPIIFGPNYDKFKEAKDLTKIKGGYSYTHENELFDIIYNMLMDKSTLTKYGNAAGEYVRNNTGATEKIYTWIMKNAFLPIAQNTQP